MTQQLAEVFGELGISQYLEAFLDQGFDTWETILDITESDLDALGVKLGHRRKLQRRIANTRGFAPDAALVSPSRPSAEESRSDSQKPEGTTAETFEPTLAVATKRKYRRHPKPDENAPERPPSAYVLFSNKMRDDLKSRNLTFTEIAKLVGENWQNLSQAEKEPFESMAQNMKDRYNHDLAEYKKTPEYRNYSVYLAEFKAKHPAQPQEKDASKRVKLSESGNQSSSSSTSGSRAPRGRSHTASASEAPVTREHRVHSTVSASDSHYSASRYALMDDNISSPSVREEDGFTERHPSASTSPREAPLHHMPTSLPGWESSSRPASMGSLVLPPLSDVLDNGGLISGNAPLPESSAASFHRHQRRPTASDNPGLVPGLIGGASRPTLRPEYSSTGSSTSSLSYPRTPMEGSLPIHALLTGKTMPSDYGAQIPSLVQASSASPDIGKPVTHHLPDRSGSDPAAGHLPLNGTGYFVRQPPVLPATSPRGASHIVHSPPPLSAGLPQTDAQRLDGMAALLQAGEIVGRRSH